MKYHAIVGMVKIENLDVIYYDQNVRLYIQLSFFKQINKFQINIINE